MQLRNFPALVVLGLVGLAVALIAAEADHQAPDELDRVGLPQNYRSTLTIIRHAYWPKRDEVITVYANEPMASVTDLKQLPYPRSSVIVFEYAVPVKNADGTPVEESDHSYRKGAVTRFDVMRKEAGYGEAYGESRAGEWEFASYFPDGRLMPLPEGAISCAKCHQQRAGAERDFVFRGRFPPLH